MASENIKTPDAAEKRHVDPLAALQTAEQDVESYWNRLRLAYDAVTGALGETDFHAVAATTTVLVNLLDQGPRILETVHDLALEVDELVTRAIREAERVHASWAARDDVLGEITGIIVKERSERQIVLEVVIRASSPASAETYEFASRLLTGEVDAAVPVHVSVVLLPESLEMKGEGA